MKAKIFGLYLGCDIAYTNHPEAEGYRADGFEISLIEKGQSTTSQLILTPLSEITDEDAIEVAKIIIDKPTTSHYNITRNNTTIWNGHNVVHIMPDGELIWSNTFVDVKLSTVKALQVADFLRSKSYALPYMGIDLFESSIAIPNNKNQ